MTYDPVEIRYQLRRSAEMQNQANQIRTDAVVAFNAQMQQAGQLLDEALTIQASCVKQTQERNETLDLENRSLNEKLGASERARELLRIETSRVKRISSGA